MNIADKVNFLYLIILGGVLHLIVDWFFQSKWQAQNKMKRRVPRLPSEVYRWPGSLVIHRRPGSKWWDRHPAAYIHAGWHTVVQFLIFPIWGALLIGFLHMLIDIRTPLTKWKEIFRQTIDLPGWSWINPGVPTDFDPTTTGPVMERRPYFGMGTHVGVWQDQAAHIVVIVVVAFLTVMAS